MNEDPRVIVVYYSRSGTTKTLAEALAKSLSCECVEIKTSAGYEGRVLGYLKALRHSMSGRRPKIEPLKQKMESYDLVVMGAPIWGGRAAAPLRAFLTSNRGKIKKSAFFLTQGGTYGREKTLRELSQDAGIDPVATLVMSARDLKSRSFKNSVDRFISRLKASVLTPLVPKKPAPGRAPTLSAP